MISRGRDTEHSILQGLPEAIVGTDRHGILHYVNAAAESLLGAHRSNILGHNIAEFQMALPIDFAADLRGTWTTAAGRTLMASVISSSPDSRVIEIRDATELSLAEERLHKAELDGEARNEFIRTVLENIDSGVVACDENGTISIFNRTARHWHRLKGETLPPEEWASYSVYYADGVTPMRREDLPLYRSFCGEYIHKVPVVIASGAGEKRTLLVSGQPLFGRDGHKIGAVIVMHDVSHRRIAGQRIRTALRQFRALFEEAPIAYHETDRAGIIRRVNRAECELLGRARHELVGRPVWEFVAEDEREISRQTVLARLAGDLPLRPFERVYVTASGQRRWLQIHASLIRDAAGQITGVRTAKLDVTEQAAAREQAEQLAREQAAREQAERDSLEIRSILERIGDAYMAFDRDWRYTYVNRKAAELALKPASVLLGRCVWDEFPEAVQTRFYAELQRALQDQVPVEFENYYAPLGKWFENSVYPHPDGVAVFYRDVTSRKETEQQLARRTDELARKNAELESFAYVASHDLQEPLRTVTTLSDKLLVRFGPSMVAEERQLVELISQAAERMHTLITGFLDVCRADQSDTSEPALADSNAALRTALENLAAPIAESGALVQAGDLPAARMRETHLAQVFQNLIGNAIKYRGPNPPSITVSAEREKRGWKFCVQDNGRGFDPKYARTIFEPFKRLDGQDLPGTGIGLAICKKVVESYGGRIWAESVGGSGSSFYFTAPDD